jgi:epoxyqueuosine reductase
MKIQAEKLIALALENGFSTARILTGDAVRPAAFLVCALPYGNKNKAEMPPNTVDYALIAPFARFNYYREAVVRLKKIAREIRNQHGGTKSDFRIFCNSSIDEKKIAACSGLGSYGRNGLIITREAGSLVVLAMMSLPGEQVDTGPEAERDVFRSPSPAPCSLLPNFQFCENCDAENPPCKTACPTGAVRGDGTINLSRCIQWFASGNGEGPPEPVRARWGRRLYGCTNCQDACPHNKRAVTGVETSLGKLDAFINVPKLLAMSDAEIKAAFKGTAMGLSWLGAAAIRRNARCAAGASSFLEIDGLKSFALSAFPN